MGVAVCIQLVPLEREKETRVSFDCLAIEMTAVLFGSIQTGSTIQIKRSDGRVHAAKVVQLSPDSKSIGVEWSENGEIKGKEILVDAVFELNTQLRPVPTRFTLDIESIEREVPARPPSQLLTKFTPTPG